MDTANQPQHVVTKEGGGGVMAQMLSKYKRNLLGLYEVHHAPWNIRQ